jgi:hypothetical protein
MTQKQQAAKNGTQSALHATLCCNLSYVAPSKASKHRQKISFNFAGGGGRQE